MRKSDDIYLLHMLDTARRVWSRVSGLDRTAFDANENLQLALAHLLQIVGEAARQVTPATRQRLTGIPWNLITGMRHRIVHDYMNVNLNVVWESSTIGIPHLIKALEAAPRAMFPPEADFGNEPNANNA